MYTNNAYLNNSTIDRKDKSKELLITMCGTYKLYTKPKLPTWRPRGNGEPLPREPDGGRGHHTD